jgi:non-ribosomal peptide synthetase component F
VPSLTMFDVLRSLRESTATVTDGNGTVPVPAVCDQAARLARALAEHGVGPDTRVGVCTDRGIGMLTALLGVWWAGGAIVPLEPGFPLPWLEIMAREAGLRLVVSDSNHAKLAGSLGGDLVVITPERNAAEPLDPVAVPADALAYTVFTSGSAGPAGVDITRRALANVLAVGQRDLGLGPGDRFVAVTTAAFDLALLELLLPLACGTHLVIAAAADTGEAGRLRSLIERTSATALHATPHIWRLLRRDGDLPASLRLRLCSGDRLPADLALSLTAPGAVLALIRPPLTRGGELDRAALLAPEWAATPVGPRNPVEADMVRIWADLLGATEPVGVHDNLFGLGSGSLAAVRFAAWVADTYAVELAIHRIVDAPTIAALAEIVSADLDSADAAETAREAELGALSDEELDDLLRALFAARDRRRAARRDGQ